MLTSTLGMTNSSAEH